MKYCTRSFPSNVNSEHNGQRKKKLSLIKKRAEAILEEKLKEVETLGEFNKGCFGRQGNKIEME